MAVAATRVFHGCQWAAGCPYCSVSSSAGRRLRCTTLMCMLYNRHCFGPKS
jgi:hypothetical protein